MKRLNQKGFSFIEIIVSLALCAIMAISVTTVVITAQQIRHINHQRLECVALSKSVIDEISSERVIWGSKDNLGSWLINKDFTKVSNVLYKKNSVDSNNIQYQITVEIIDTGMENLFDVKVTSSSRNVDAISITKRLRSG